MKLHLAFLATLHSLLCLAQNGYVPGEPRLAYWEVGSSEDVVVILHGGPCASHQYLRPEFDRLSSVAKVIYYDQRGCGQSDTAGSYYWQDHVIDLHRVVNHFTENHEVFLAGSSWGSILAILYSYSYPYGIKGVILSGTIQWNGVGKDLSDMKWPELRKGGHRIYEFKIIEKKRVESGDMVKSDNGYYEISRDVKINSGPQSTHPLWSLTSAPPFRKLENIYVPKFLIFRGLQKNRFGSPDWGHVYNAILPKSSLVTIEHAGHDPWLSDPDTFFEEAKQFILENK